MWARKIFKFIKVHIIAFSLGFGFAVLSFVGVNAAMEPFSTSDYCGRQCHEMRTSYDTWEISEHGAGKIGVRVECIDCHLPPKEKFFSHLAVKAYYGARDVYKHYFGDEYDLEKFQKKVFESMRDQTCLYCHDNLLANPSGPAAKIAHVASLAGPDLPETRCLACHEQTGHQRKDKADND